MQFDGDATFDLPLRVSSITMSSRPLGGLRSRREHEELFHY